MFISIVHSSVSVSHSMIFSWLDAFSLAFSNSTLRSSYSIASSAHVPIVSLFQNCIIFKITLFSKSHYFKIALFFKITLFQNCIIFQNRVIFQNPVIEGITRFLKIMLFNVIAL